MRCTGLVLLNASCTLRGRRGSITRAYMYYHDCSISITIRRLSHQDQSRQQAKTTHSRRSLRHVDPCATNLLIKLHEWELAHSRSLGNIDVAVCQQFISQIISSRPIRSSGTVPFTTMYDFSHPASPIQSVLSLAS